MKKILGLMLAVSIAALMGVSAMAADFVCPNGYTACTQNGACMNNNVCVQTEYKSRGHHGGGHNRGRGHNSGNGHHNSHC